MTITATSYGTAQNKAAATTVVVTTTALIPANTFLVLAVCCDNVAAATPTISSITAVGGSTWANQAGAAGSQSGASTTAGTGVFVYCQTLFTASSVASGTAITITFNASPVAKAVGLWGFPEVTGNLRTPAASGTSTAGTPSVLIQNGVVGDLVIGVIGGENSAVPTGDADTLNGTWSTIAGIATTGSTAATNVCVGMQYKVLTVFGNQTFNPVTLLDSVAIGFVVFPVPAVTQAAYRFYADGTETGSTDLAAENTFYIADVTAGDVNLLIRLRLQSTITTGPNANDDWQLQVEKNSSGTWTDVTAASATVAGYNSTNLTDAAATTNRLTAGTGSFVAGKVSEDGLLDNLGWAANNYTEALYAVTLKAADLANADTLRFRVLRNAATTAMTYTQTPTIPITKATTTGRPKVYLAGAFTKKPLKVWTGAAWVEKPIKVWTGSAWKTLT